MTRVAALLTCAALLRRPQGGDEATIVNRHRLSKLAPAFQPAEDQEGHYIHLGCLVDKIGDRVPGMELIRDDMTTEASADRTHVLCYEYCNAQESLYMATQYGNECFCGRDGGPDYSRHRPGICDQPCAGDESERCGSYYSFDLYEIVWPDASTYPEYMDCYADSPEERLMSDTLISDDMTTVLCRDHCKDKGALYYATQFGKECWCGHSDVFEYYEKHGPGTCHMRCAGDRSEPCGGWYSLSLYRFNEYSPEPAVSTSGSSVGSVFEPNAEPVLKHTSGMIPFDGIDFTGDDTHYRETSTCSIPSPLPSMYDGMIPVALGKDQFDGLEECGACIEGERYDNASDDYFITASFKAYVIDKCSECTHGSLSFIESEDGSLDISWRFVPCPSSSEKPASILERSHEYDIKFPGKN